MSTLVAWWRGTPAPRQMRWALLIVIGAAIVPLLAGCGSSVDGEQLRLCRNVIPAINPDGTQLREMRYGPSALVQEGVRAQEGVRIDYVAQAPGEASRMHYVTCGFAGRTFSADRLELVAVETDSGPLGDARLYYLKRFWLASPVNAGEAMGEPVVPLLPPSIAYLAQQFINAIALSAVYALLATAYSLIYGITGRINLAFGEIAMLGAYGAIGGIAVLVTLGLDDPFVGIAVALAAAAAFSGLWSAAIGRYVIAPLHARHRLGQPILVATAGLAVALQELLHLSQGVRDRWVPSLFKAPIALARAGAFVVTVTPLQIAVVISTLAAAAGMLWLFTRTRFGRSWRAYADDPHTAALLGVDGARLLSTTFVLAGACAGLAGAVVGIYYGNVGSAMGTMLGIKALIAALLGGIGSVPGAFLGGLAVGLIETAWSAYFDMTLRDMVIYTFLVILFLLRPGGLFGLADPEPPQIGRAGV
jgi:branched-subunit amino acid ABC-type transport system permease component